MIHMQRSQENVKFYEHHALGNICSCSIQMSILTSTHGWTDNSDINVKVYAVNTDGVSSAAT
jgi:hypothetical protein